MWGWLDEQRGREAQRAAGWAGVISLPRVLSLGEDGELLTAFVPELRSLRREGTRVDALEVAETVNVDTKGPALELRLTIKRGDASRSGLLLARSPDGEEETRVYVDWTAGRLIIDRERSSRLEDTERRAQSGALDAGDELELHLYLDGSVLELVANKKLVLSTRIYPSRPESVGVGLFAQGGRSTFGLEAWRLASIW